MAVTNRRIDPERIASSAPPDSPCLWDAAFKL
jgi:hypothetical protein